MEIFSLNLVAGSLSALQGTAGHAGVAWPATLGASPFDVPLMQVALWGASLLTLLGAYVLVLTAIAKHKEAFGRRPSYDDELRKLRESMEGLAPSEQVERLLSQFATAATKQEVATVMSAATALIEREIEAHKKDVAHQLTEVRTYTHDNVHDLRGYVDLLTQRGEDREQRYTDKLDALVKGMAEQKETLDGKRSRSVAELHQQLKAAEIQIAGIKTATETLAQTQAAQHASNDQKLTNILQRLPRGRGGEA